MKLYKEEKNLFTNAALYRTVLGSLQYATITRPEIRFAVNKVCQFMQNPLEEDRKAVKHILRHLAGTIGLHFLLKLDP